MERAAAGARAVQPEGVLRGLQLHPPQSGRARRDLARPVRGAARRRDGAVAGVRARRVRGRALGARAVARRARGRRAHHGARADALAVRATTPGGSCSRRSRPTASRPSCSRSSGSFVVALVALVVLGASDMVSVVIRMTLVQLATPDAMRGRVTAVNSLFIGTSNQLGEFRAGAMAAWLGAVPAALIGGIGTLLIVVMWMRLFPQLCCGSSKLESAARRCSYSASLRRIGAARRSRASDRGNPPARRGCRGRRPGGRRNARGAAWRPASPCARRRAWSSGTSWRG